QLQIGYSLEKCRQDGGMTLIPGIHFPTNREEPDSAADGPRLLCASRGGTILYRSGITSPATP
ncbi:hypothetical protein, partial [Pseudarthrobacter oxydans]|uniref:hypothetical protein n=1 Tax=Pseudarthrobacter oxydans TaxID=1671 RepID=UPI0034225811